MRRPSFGLSTVPTPVQPSPLQRQIDAALLSLDTTRAERDS